MKFKKLVHITMNTNSDRNLVLRQQFALKYIELLISGRTILNIDETWCGMSDMRRMKWRVPGSTNSHAVV